MTISFLLLQQTSGQPKPHKPDARSGSYGIGRAIHASRLPLAYRGR